jgi:hypothetical protein
MKRRFAAGSAAVAALCVASAVAWGDSFAETADPPPGNFFIEAKLKGGAVVPGPGDPGAKGIVGLDPYSTRGRLCYGLKVTGLDTVTGAYVHKGERGEAGPQRLTLFEDAAGRPGTGYYRGCVTGIDERLIRHVIAPRGGKGWPWYAEVRTAEHPAGAVRGQFALGISDLSLPDKTGR